MSRIGTCKDCGARFKVPDSTTASRAKCAKCGGVVEIPAADEAPATPGNSPVAKAAAAQATPAKAPTAKPAAGKLPSRAAPTSARKASSTPKSAGTKTVAGAKPAGKARGAAAPAAGDGDGDSDAKPARSGSRRSGASSRKSSRGASAGESKKGAPKGLIAVIVIVALGGAAAFFVLRDSEPTPTPTTPIDESSLDTGASSSTGGTDVGDTEPADEAEKAPSPVDIDQALAASSLEKAPPATASATGQSGVPAEPLPTLIEFEDFPPVVGSSADELSSWTALLFELYIEDSGAVGRTRKRLQDQEAELDPITAVPAYLNALNGVDFADTDAIKSAFSLIQNWQERVANTPTFYFDGDISRMDVIDQNKRVEAVRNWINWWKGQRKSGQDAADLEDYRQKVATALAKKADS